jgi:hypothetical protein
MSHSAGSGPVSKSLSDADKHREHETRIRSLVACAHEVRIHLHDARVVFGSVMVDHAVDTDAFVIRPWGRALPMTIRFDEVLRLAPVKQMDWQRQRTISSAQIAGVYTDSSRPAESSGPR